MNKKLEVGCGDHKREGYIGMDIVPLAGVDVVHDMNKIPWPFAQSEFDEIVFDDVLEHSNNFLGIIEEIYRVSKNSCIIKISVPHFSSDNMYSDPTHTTFFSSRSFNYFDKSLGYKHDFYLQNVNFKIRKVHLSFREYFTQTKRPFFNPLKWIGIELLINKFNRIYERFFCWILPAAEIYFELEIVKD
ncbi:MAG: hypothetical protein V3V72_01500 [Ignavibacteriaceae bacterium]